MKKFEDPPKIVTVRVSFAQLEKLNALSRANGNTSHSAILRKLLDDAPPTEAAKNSNAPLVSTDARRVAS